MVRRLPVLQDKASTDEAASERPRSHWVAIGAGLTLTLWVPLLLAGFTLGRKLAMWLAGVNDPSELGVATGGVRIFVIVALVGPSVLSLGIACFVAAALVARFGGGALRDGVLGTSIAGLAAWGLAAAGGSLSPWPVTMVTGALLLALSSGFGALGTRFGVSRRSRP